MCANAGVNPAEKAESRAVCHERAERACVERHLWYMRLEQHCGLMYSDGNPV